MAMVETQSQRDSIEENFRFVRSLLQASVAGMFWIEQDLSLADGRFAGMPSNLLPEYFAGMSAYDPLNFETLIQRHRRVALLERERSASPDDIAIYKAFLGRYGIIDEADFLFWQDGEPIAMMAVMKREADPPFSADGFQWDTLQRHLEFHLQQHPRIRQMRKERLLASRYDLTARELEVVGLLEIGASNARIAEIMGIGVATVKTYVVNILDKLGLESRFSVVAFTASL